MNDAQSIDELVLEHLLQSMPNPISKPFYSELIEKYGKEKTSMAIRAMEVDGLITPCTSPTLVGYMVANRQATLTEKGEAIAKTWKTQE